MSEICPHRVTLDSLKMLKIVRYIEVTEVQDHHENLHVIVPTWVNSFAAAGDSSSLEPKSGREHPILHSFGEAPSLASIWLPCLDLCQEPSISSHWVHGNVQHKALGTIADYAVRGILVSGLDDRCDRNTQ